MNGSRSNNYNSFAKESTLETLSRTIEDLENKILGASNASHGGSSSLEQSNGIPVKFSQPGNLSNEVRARQQSLSGGNPQAFARVPQQGFIKTTSQQEQKFSDQNHQSSGDLAALLSQLRHELKQDMQATINGEIGNLQKDIMELRQVTIKDDMPASLGSDLEQIAQSLKQLETVHAAEPNNQDIDSLRLEVDSLRNLVDNLAREDTLIGLDNRWSSIEQNLRGFDPNIMKGEFSDLSSRLTDMRLTLANMHQNGPVLGPLEEKMERISIAVAELMGRPDPSQNYNQFTELTSQTEQRLAQLAAQMEALSAQGETGLIERIEAISARINILSSEGAFQNLEKRMEHLQASLDNNSDAGHFPQLNEQLIELSSKVDAFDQRSSTVETAGIERLVSQLTDVATHLDERAKPVEIDGIDRLEEQLQLLNARLDNNKAQAGSNVDGSNINGLQNQIEQLSELIRNTSVGDVSEKLDNLHEHLNTNDEFVLEAAKQAAEATLQAYGSNSGLNGNSDATDNVVLGLANELKHLEKLQRSNEDRSVKAFDTVQQSLVKIVDGLERLNSQVNDTPAQSMPASFSSQATDHKAENYTSPSMAPEDIPVKRETRISEIAADAPTVMPDAPMFSQEERVETPSREQDAPGRGANSLLAGLASRMKTAISEKNDDDVHGQRSEPTSQSQQPSAQQPLASHNALDELESEFADEPLEPGSGAPDINSIMQKVRDVQKTRGAQETASALNPEDVVSSARRAALAATAEVGAEEEQPKKRRIKFKEKSDSSPLVSKPVLITAGVILVAILAFPVVKQVLNFGTTPDQSAQVVTEQNEQDLGEVQTAVPNAVQNDANNLDITQLENAGPRIVDLPNTTASTIVSDTQEKNIIASAGEENSLVGQQPIFAPEINDVDSAAPDVSVPLQQAGPNAFAAVNDLPPVIVSGAMKEAALSGDAIALYEIAIRYADGRGTDVALDKAMTWLELSANQGFAPAQYRLGNMYEKGEGVERDLGKARELYLQSADNGNISAMHNLGVLLASSGNIGDMAKAADWFRQAADFGVRDSQVNMAILHARGEGLPRDLVESYKWFAIAAQQGDQDAAIKRDQVLNALPPERAEIAKEKVKSWAANPVDSLANNVQIPDAWISENTGTASIDMKKAIKNIQAILNNNGYDAGRPDGIIGKRTTDAIKAFQASIGMEENGQISDKLVQELLKRNG